MGAAAVGINLLKTPKVLQRLIHQRLAVRTKFSSQMVPTRGLNLLVLIVTRRCNMRCEMCIQSHAAHKSREEEDRLTLEDYDRILDRIKPLDPIIQITGGEPFLYPDIGELISMAKRKGFFCMINTNGALLAKYAAQLVETGVEKVTVSLDGPPEVHDKIRRFKGAHEMAMKGLEALAEEKRKRRSRYPFVDVKGVITPDNVGQLEPVAELSATGLVQMVDLVHMWFLHQVQVEAHKARGFNVGYYTPHQFCLFEPDLLQEAVSHVRYLQKKYRWRPFIVFPDFSDEVLREYYAHPDKPIHRMPCIYPYEAARILPTGEVLACPEDVAAKAPLGNLRKDGEILEIIRGKTAENFFAKLDRAQGAFPVCYRCCGLFRS